MKQKEVFIKWFEIVFHFRADLPRAEDAGLRGASDGRLELERLRQQAFKLVRVFSVVTFLFVGV
jgi:hypothetical protein